MSQKAMKIIVYVMILSLVLSSLLAILRVFIQ